ncbi:pseudouridine synthase [Thiomicrorhabdus sp. Milos-T2]|uniref:pseudouridine synthase n=1 Tax=Thiomicrorhabdus sp. Milos-T2 TaxID=90814 RepID=UPI000493FE06|nr:pseudouridine synthase [Thiomicrorhabdus sp. Milos-T2]
MHLDRYLSKYAGLSRKSILRLLHLGQIKVDGKTCFSRDQSVSDFSKIHIEGQLLELHKPARYFLMNKPAGILSATIDSEHKTALELIDEAYRSDLHIAGRLDRATTGLLILTNNGKWSRHITEPEQKIPKTYRVKTQYSISPETEALFKKGIYFAYENITTSPAEIEILTPTLCKLTIYEGRYHQVKRMFSAIGNRVKQLHRESIGNIVLEEALQPGEYRCLSQKEIDSIWQK